MSKRTITIFVGLILGCGIFLAGGISLTRGVAVALAARGPSENGPGSAGRLKPAPTTPRATPSAAGAGGELKGTIKEWDVPTKGAHPHDPAMAPDGSLWVTEQFQNKLGRLDPATGAFQDEGLKIVDFG